MGLRSAEIAKVVDIVRGACSPMVRDFHEIQKLQGSRSVVGFFQKLYKRTELFLLRELALYKATSGINFSAVIFPIEGKKNFLRGIHYFATSVLLKKGDEPFICVIEEPISHTTFWAEKNCGAFLEDLSGMSRLRVSQNADLTQSLILLSHAKNHNKLKNCRVLGSLSLEAAYIASGRADCLIVNTELVQSNLISLITLIVEESGGNISNVGSDMVFTNFDLGPQIKNCLIKEKNQDPA